MVGQHDPGAEHRAVSGVASTGKMLTLVRPASSGETNLPSESSITRCVEISDSASAAPATARRDVGRVVHAGADDDGPSRSGGCERNVNRHPRPAA